jgi:hypothetical protein
LTLHNVDKSIRVHEGAIWFNTRFKLYTGFYFDSLDDYYFILQGTFCITNVKSSDSLEKRDIDIEAADKFVLLNGELSGSLSAIYTIPNNTLVRDAIQAILDEVGDTSELIFSSTYSTLTTTQTYTYRYSDTYASILSDLGYIRTSNYYYDKDGHFCFIEGDEDTDSAIKPTQYYFRNDGTDINYINSVVEYDFKKMKNSVKVVSTWNDGQIFTGEAKITDPSSSFRIGLVGERLLPVIEDNNISSDAFCTERAEYELYRAVSLASILNIECLPMPHLDSSQVIEISNDVYNFDHARYLIQSIRYPLKDGATSTLTCANVLSSYVVPSTSDAAQLVSLVETAVNNAISQTTYVNFQRATVISYNQTNGYAQIQFPADSTTVSMLNISGQLLFPNDVVIVGFRNSENLSTGYILGSPTNTGTSVVTNVVISQAINSNYGRIADLIANGISTDYSRPDRYLNGDITDLNYIHTEDQAIQWITASTDGTVSIQYRNRDNELLYWTDNPTSPTFSHAMTLSATAWPVIVYEYDELIKLKISFEDVEGTYIPRIELGAGDGYRPLSAKGVIYKGTTGLELNYYKSGNEALRQIKLSDDGVFITPYSLDSIDFYDNGFTAVYSGEPISFTWTKNGSGLITSLITEDNVTIPVTWNSGNM